MDFRDGERFELFAGTPPTEAMRVLCSMAATVEDEIGEGSEEKIMMINDVKRAYFYAPVNRPICVELPREDYTEALRTLRPPHE